MGESDRNPVAALVIGTCHEYQRHQDKIKEREEIRAVFEQVIRRMVEEQGATLIAEEAGNKEEVLAQLRADEAATPSEFAVLFGGTEAVDEPQDTIAKLVADEIGCKHVDIRPPHANEMTIEQCDAAMAEKTVEALGSATDVLVICGEVHREGLSKRLEGYGLHVKSQRFPHQV